MHIWNRASSFDNDWMSMISSKILSTEESTRLDRRNDSKIHHYKTGIEMRYEIKTTVFCKFDHSKYPMDDQTCDIRYGSGSSSAIFVLSSEQKDSQNLHHRTRINQAADFKVSISFFDMETSHGNNTVGMKIAMDRIIFSFILKYYVPCMAIVLVSIIGFVIPATAIPGRVALLVTQFLTLINLFIYQMVSQYNKINNIIHLSRICLWTFLPTNTSSVLYDKIGLQFPTLFRYTNLFKYSYNTVRKSFWFDIKCIRHVSHMLSWIRCRGNS